MKPTTIFISYSHDSDSHKSWVLALATDLKRSGLSVILDDSHLKPGDDLAVFMEESIEAADFVLLVCTPVFGHKVNNREGGVAYESNILLGSLLTNASPGKIFIPLLREGLPSESIPRYLRSKLFINFSADNRYSDALRILLMRLLDAPDYQPPVQPKAVTNAGSNGSPVPLYKIKAWLLVAGIGIPRKVTTKISTTADSLGRLLVKHQYGLITGGWPGVDEIVARAFSQELYKYNLPVENYLTQVLEKTDMPEYPGGNLVLFDSNKDGYLETVSLCDAIVLINGEGGTLETAYYGERLNKPVFPLADSGGDAKEFYVRVLTNWDRYPYRNFHRHRFQSLGGMLPESLDALFALLQLQFEE